MKIICLIQPAPHMFYFVNMIHQHHKVDSVFIETASIDRPLWQKTFHRFKTNGFLDTMRQITRHTRQATQKHHHTHENNRWFNRHWQALNKEIECIKVKSINDPIVLEKIQKESPELLLDHGTSIVKNEIIDAAELALNLHWGLSPYYRGVYCTEWALLNNDPHNIGVTIHKLSKNIDGGSILSQQRADLAQSNSVYAINMQLSYLGTQLMINAIEKLKNNEELTFQHQDHSDGHLILKRDWNILFEKKIRQMEKYNEISDMIHTIQRETSHPIIQA